MAFKDFSMLEGFIWGHSEYPTRVKYRLDAGSFSMAGGFGRRKWNFMDGVAMFVEVEFLIIGSPTFFASIRTDMGMVLLGMLSNVTFAVWCFIGTRVAVFVGMRAFKSLVFEFANTVMKSGLMHFGGGTGARHRVSIFRLQC